MMDDNPEDAESGTIQYVPNGIEFKTFRQSNVEESKVEFHKVIEKK